MIKPDSAFFDDFEIGFVVAMIKMGVINEYKLQNKPGGKIRGLRATEACECCARSLKQHRYSMRTRRPKAVSR
jgi:hypothetical protein